MDAGSGLLDGLFSSVRRVLAEESCQSPPYPSNRRRADTAATTADDLVRRSSLPDAKDTTATAGGAGIQYAGAGEACSTEVAGGDLDSSVAAGGSYLHHRFCEADHGTMRAILARRAGGREARESHEKILHREIKVRCPKLPHSLCFSWRRGWQCTNNVVPTQYRRV